MTFTVPATDCVVRYTNGVAHVPIHCASCSETVRVEGVTTIAGALAELARLGVHQH